jgi:deazaflavin-dependent oxidoreductase (nitroreductase family)
VAGSTRDWAAFNRGVVEKFRKDGGRSSGKSPVLLLTTKGARTGRERVNPLNFSRDGERYIVMASKGGSPTHPDWYHNLIAHPVATVEADGERFTARATVSEGAERQRLLKIHTSAMPFFAAYERRVKRRQIPVIALARAREASRPSARRGG